MARIRSIHPNTPTDPELAAIPIPGRLLFVYSWTIADDAGNLERNPRGLKMSLFPGDDSMTVKKIAKLAEELIAGRFYVPYDADGKQYLHIRNFAKYQKLDHPTAPKVPLAPGQEYVYHVRQGNTYTPRTENGPPLIPRTTHEQHTNSTRTLVCRSRRTGLDRTGLERTGKERRGPGKEGTGEGNPTPYRRPSVASSTSPEKRVGRPPLLHSEKKGKAKASGKNNNRNNGDTDSSRTTHDKKIKPIADVDDSFQSTVETLVHSLGGEVVH